MEERKLEGKGEFDYDYIQDILFFKVKDREYKYSIEAGNMVIDLDKENFIVGIQIFDASKFLKISKLNLRKIPKWKFSANLHENRVVIRLGFSIEVRNKIKEVTPIITEPLPGNLPDSEMICAPIRA